MRLARAGLLWLLSCLVVDVAHAEPLAAADRSIARGEYGSALRELAPLVKRQKPRALALTGRVHLLRGERAEAERAFQRLIALYNDDKIKDSDGEGLWAVAEAARALGSFRDASETFARAVKAAPDNLDIEIAWANLFLAKYDAGNAEVGLRRVLAVKPEHARALERLARAKMEQGADFAAVEELLTRALKSDPELVPAFVTRAGIALRDEDLALADRHLDAALALNPHDLEALSVRAAVRFVADDRPGFDTAVQRVLKENPVFSRLYSIVGTYAEWEHRYDELVELGDRALVLDPEDPYAHAMRALNLLRVGREQEGLQALEAAWSRDRYNVHVYNTLNLYDDVISKEYESFEVAPFRFRMHKQERPVLERYAVPLVTRAFEDMKKRYGFTPETPISIELYANAEHFSVRTVGLPQLGVQGVCFGKVLTALSPRGGEFNWGQILWHELSHVFHVQRSKSRVPRWFTEGLAEYETTRARPEWKREEDRLLWDALEEDRLPSLRSMNHAFTHARAPQDLMVAYYASSVAVTYIVERFGFDAVPRILTLFAEGVPASTVFERALGLDMDALDREFREAVRTRLSAKYARDMRVELKDYADSEARRAAAEKPDASPKERAAFALALAVKGSAERAEGLAREVLKVDPKQPIALFARAHIALMQGDLAAARDRLTELLAQGHESYQVRMLLARANQKLGLLEPALEQLELAARVDPERLDAYELMIRIADDKKDAARLERGLAQYSLLDQHARIPLARTLNVLEQKQAYGELLTRAESGLYLDPESSALHRQLALALLHEKGPREAKVELEVARKLAVNDEQKAAAEALRTAIAAAERKKPSPSSAQGQEKRAVPR